MNKKIGPSHFNFNSSVGDNKDRKKHIIINYADGSNNKNKNNNFISHYNDVNVKKKNINNQPFKPSVLIEDNRLVNKIFFNDCIKEFDIQDNVDLNDIKNIVLNFKLDNLDNIISFGDDILKENSNLLTNLLKISTIDRDDDMFYLNKIISIINSIEYDDFLGKENNILKKIFIKSDISLNEKINKAINEIEVCINYLESKIINMKKNLLDINNINDDYKKICSSLNNNIISLKILYKYFSISNDNNEEHIKDYINRRLNILLESKITYQSTDIQIKLIQENLLSKIDYYKNVILILVSNWKSQCISALTLLNNNEDIYSLKKIIPNILLIKDEINNKFNEFIKN